MNLSEYQTKMILDAYKLPLPIERNLHAYSEHVIHEIIKDIGEKLVIKAQIPYGGRRFGYLKNHTDISGIEFVSDVTSIKNVSKMMLYNNLITAQTPSLGSQISCITFAKYEEISREIYLSYNINRSKSSISLLISNCGGSNIEQHSETIREWNINIMCGILPFQDREIIRFLKLSHDLSADFLQTVHTLFQVFCENDMLLLEINPLALTKNNTWKILDAKCTIDDSALYRQCSALKLIKTNDSVTNNSDVRYVKISDGNIGCVTNGAGLAMATIDLLITLGGIAANFLDIGGEANKSQILNAINLVLQGSNINVLYINIFGGMANCVSAADGIMECNDKFSGDLYCVVRFEGVGKVEASAIVNSLKNPYIVLENDLQKSATLAVRMSQR